MKNVIVRSRRNAFREETKLLVKKYGFLDINNGETSKGLKSPKEIALMFLQDCAFVIRNAGKINHADTVIAFGFTALPVKLLLKLKLIRCQQLLWFGFFIHSDKAFRIFRVVLKLLSIKHEKLILNSQYEIPLYAKKLEIPTDKLTYIPFGDWKKVDLYDETYNPNVDEAYYFAGGYTNRDYTGVISTFSKLPYKIVIVGSHLNKELNDRQDLPDNIIIKQDIPKEQFESLLGKAKACILPLKDDTGASGHMVLLGYMRNKKAIIASNMEAMQEYLTHEKSALLFDDARKDLATLIEAIESREYDLAKLGEEAYNTYQKNFTFPALSQHLLQIVENDMPRAKNSINQ